MIADLHGGPRHGEQLALADGTRTFTVRRKAEPEVPPAAADALLTVTGLYTVVSPVDGELKDAAIRGRVAFEWIGWQA